MARWVMVCDQDTAPVVLSGGSWDCPSGQVVSVEALLQAAAPGAIPDAADVAALWTASFSMVVLCFVVGRGVGALLELIKKG